MTNRIGRSEQEHWLKRYYFARACFSILWVAAVLTFARNTASTTAIFLVAYPAWDALANGVDGVRSGGLTHNRGQLVNVIASVAAAVGIAVALPDMHHVLAVFGAWAVLAGVLQLGTAIGRWTLSGAQWTMILSGAQSALAGAVFIAQARTPAEPTIATVAGYAGFGAFYFLLSALLLTIKVRRRAQG